MSMMSQQTLEKEGESTEIITEIRLYHKLNATRTGRKDPKTGKDEWKVRPLWLARITIDENGKENREYINDRGPLYLPEYYMNALKAGKQSFFIKQDGKYKARECDRFDNGEIIEHTFEIKDGEVINGVSRKVKGGGDVASGFSLEHL